MRFLIGSTAHQVLVVDKLTYANDLNCLKEVADDPRFRFLRADICDFEAMRDVVRRFRPDVVMHLAAETHVDRSIDGPAPFIETNVRGTFILLQVALDHWTGLRGAERDRFRFHHISTDEVFGALGPVGRFTEQSQYRPNSPYAATKAASDHLVRAWHHTHGLPVVLSNCSNNFGPFLIGIAAPAPGTFMADVKSLSMPFPIGGVDLFFVLSGMLIGGILIDNRGASNFFKAFWTRRIARIFPVNYALVASYGLALFVQSRWHFPQLDIYALMPPVHSRLWYVTFTQSFPLALTDWGPRWMGITWSLAIEEQFYLLFPLLVYLLNRRQIVILSIVAIIVSPILSALVEWSTDRSDTGYVLLPCRMFALFLGVLVACIVRHAHAFALARRVGGFSTCWSF